MFPARLVWVGDLLVLAVHPSDLEEMILHGLSDDRDVQRGSLVLRRASCDYAQMVVGSLAICHHCQLVPLCGGFGRFPGA